MKTHQRQDHEYFEPNYWSCASIAFGVRNGIIREANKRHQTPRPELTKVIEAHYTKSIINLKELKK